MFSQRTLFKASVVAVYAVSTASADPTVTNVTAAQRPDNSRLIDIRYDLASAVPCTVWFVVSANGGTNWNTPAMTYTGAVGPNVSAGTEKTVVWDAGADIPGKVGNFKVRVYADDGQGTNMVLVPGGTYPYQNSGAQQVYIATFLIDKFEVTNQRYCEFLNSADPDGEHWVANMEISRTGQPPNVTYVVNDGRQNYPVRWASALDADAYATWLSQSSGQEYRLPTEQEWEKAAAWNNLDGVFSYYGFQGNIDCTRCNHRTFSWPFPHCVGSTTEVGYYSGASGTVEAKSHFGCFDMSGNVSEWTHEIFGGDNRVIRGGGYNSFPQDATTVYRIATNHLNRDPSVGFRLIRVLP